MAPYFCTWEETGYSHIQDPHGGRILTTLWPKHIKAVLGSPWKSLHYICFSKLNQQGILCQSLWSKDLGDRPEITPLW